jgi:Xaa-Pro aminopeptidase
MLTHPHAMPDKVQVKDCTHILSELRMVKDPEEIECIRQAAWVASSAMTDTLRALHPGMTESQVAAEAEYAMRQAGAEAFWRTYVSSGPRTNLAHGLPTNRKILPGDLVMIDIHPIVDNYSADICRTICAGEPEPEQQAAYDLFLEAQQSTINLARVGVGMIDLEGNLHTVLKAGGHGDHIFGPPIHGVGIDFEESPLPPGHAFFHGEKPPPPLPENVVLAVGNCGIYTGPWGVRIEDTIVITADEPMILTNASRRLA